MPTGATAVAAYSLRAPTNALVSTPIAWIELKSGVPFDHFNLKTVLARLDQMKNDPGADFFSTRQTVTKTTFARVGPGKLTRQSRPALPDFA